MWANKYFISSPSSVNVAGMDGKATLIHVIWSSFTSLESNGLLYSHSKHYIYEESSFNMGGYPVDGVDVNNADVADINTEPARRQPNDAITLEAENLIGQLICKEWNGIKYTGNVAAYNPERRCFRDSLTEMKPLKPKIEITSYGYTMVFAVSVPKHDNLEGSRKRGRSITTILIKELETSFRVPHNCIAHQLDMDTIALVYRTKAYQNEGKMMCAPQFSFQERLEGWYIETRQRLTSICDTVEYREKTWTWRPFLNIW